MKKLLLIGFFTATVQFSLFGQTPKETDQEISPSSLTIFDNQQTAAGVVIIDDDELGATVAPNPANSSTTVSATKSLNNKTFSIFDNSGNTVLQQKLTSNSNTVDVSHLNSGMYYWSITDALNKRLSSGNLVVQH